MQWTQKNSRIQRNSNHRVRTQLLSRTPESLELKMPFSHRAGLQRTALESIHSTKSLEPRSRLTERKVRVSTPDASASQHVISKFNFFKPVWRSRTVYDIIGFYWAKYHMVFFLELGQASHAWPLGWIRPLYHSGSTNLQNQLCNEMGKTIVQHAQLHLLA